MLIAFLTRILPLAVPHLIAASRAIAHDPVNSGGCFIDFKLPIRPGQYKESSPNWFVSLNHVERGKVFILDNLHPLTVGHL